MSPVSSLTHNSTTRVVEVINTQPGLPLNERLRLRLETRSPLEPKQVRIGMLAMSILPADLLQMQQQYGVRPDVPYVPGHEGVAVVLEIGQAITDLKVGEHVIPMGAGGLWADERVVSRRALVALPEGDVLQQAMLTANPATAWVLLKHQRALASHGWVLQNAANSAVGQCIRQVAAHLGLRVLNIVRRADAVPAGSVEHWLIDDGSRPANAVVAEARQIMGSDPAALGLDALGGQSSATMAACLADGGRLVVYGLISGQPSQMAAQDLVFRGVEVGGFWLARWFGDVANRESGKAVYPALVSLAQAGALQMAVEQVYDLGEVAAALEHAARSRRQGKVLLRGSWHKG